MNIMTKRGSQDNVVTYEHYCDTVSDLNNIPKSQVTLGSVAIVVNGESDGIEVYIADSQKRWAELTTMNGGSEGGSSIYNLLHICAQDEYNSNTLIPTIEEPSDTTIYLVPGGSGNDLYQEWIYVNDEWEKFGVGTIEMPDVENVSGTAVTITGEPNTRYVCGEVATISITPPQSGIIDVMFTSGSTATVLTVPNMVQWPEWFDPTSLAANTTYEINVMDGIYGLVMAWKFEVMVEESEVTEA